MEFAKYFIYLFAGFGIFYGLISFKKLSPFFKAIHIQITLYLLFILALFVSKTYLENNGVQFNNILYLNIHVGVEAIILLYAGLTLLKEKMERLVLSSLTVGFIISFLSLLCLLDANEYIVLTDVIACILLTVTFTFILFKLFKDKSVKWWKNPEILVSIGLVTYFAGSVPFISMSAYLAKNATHLYFLFFDIINDSLAVIRYLLVALAFYLIYRTKGKNQLQH